MITKDLGAVSAYAYAVEQGYTGTEAEYAELMASYASVAQQASQSAQTATEKAQQASASATSASQSADTASASAQTAQTAQQTASTKASEAQQSATTATTKAQEASQSASESSQSASTAVQAKTDAETAKQASETAQGLAESARDGAVTAKEDAESARDEAQDIVDGITGKVEQIDSNTERTESLEDDRYKPYAVDSASGSIASFADGADSIPMKDVVVHIEPVQEGSGDPSPDNVRPITGWTGVKVTRTGKNLLNQSAYIFQAKEQNGLTYTVQSDGTIHVTGTATALGGPNLINRFNLPNGTYTYLGETSRGVHCAYRGLPVSGGSSFSLPNPFTVDGTFVIYINLFCKATGTFDLTVHPQIELGTTATAYEPYSGQTYSITFPSEAGTVYGGTLDVTKGELTVDRAMVDLGTLSWIYVQNYKYFTSGTLSSVIASPVSATTPIAGLLCSIYKTDSAQNAGSGNVNKTIAVDMYNFLRIKDLAYTDVNAWKEAVGSQTIVYPLATPITYTLTPQEITSLLGTNNLWADTGDTEVEYRADVTLYINKKIAEAISALS